MRPKLAIAGVVFIVLGLVIGFGWWWPNNAETSATVHEPVRKVRIDDASGDVDIRVGDGTSTSVRQDFDYNWSQPGDAYSMDGDTLALADCGRNCSVDYRVVVPKGTTVTGSASSGEITLDGVASVDVRASSGTITVRDVAGSVRAETTSGDVRLARVRGDVTLRAGSGDISGTGLDGKVTANASSGDIELTTTSQRDVRAEASSGDIAVRVADGAYRVDAHAASGDERIDVPTDPSAQHSLELAASSGDITLTTVTG